MRFGGNVALDMVNLSAEPGLVTGLIGPNGAGQDDAVQRDHRPAAAERRAGADRRHQRVARPPVEPRPARHGAHVPAARALQPALGAREHPRRGRHPAHRRRRSARVRRRHHRARRARRRGRRARRQPLDRPRPPGRARTRARDRSPRCSCSTSPPPARTRTRPRRSACCCASSRTEDIAVVLVEHDMQLVMQVCDVIHVLDFGRIIAAGHAARDPARRSGARRVPRDEVMTRRTDAPCTDEIATRRRRTCSSSATSGRVRRHRRALRRRPRRAARLGGRAARARTARARPPRCASRPGCTRRAAAT